MIGGQFFVEFASVKRPGTTCSEGYDTLAEAVAVCRIQREAGRFASIRCDDFRAIPVLNKMAARPVLKWSLGFPRATYRGSATIRAEQAGVRYASHRTGYVASDRAFRRFVASWDEFCVWCALPDVAAMRAANAGSIAA